MSNEIINRTPAQENAIAGPVAEHILSHLDEEKATLEAMLRAVREVHHSLMHLDKKTLEQSLEAEARELISSLAIQERRQQLQGELAAVLHVAPQEITLKRLITLTSGSVRESIERIWRSLVEMAKEVDRLNRQNAAMINQSLSIVRGVVEQLTGATAVGESYNATGSRTDTHVGPIIQWGA